MLENGSRFVAPVLPGDARFRSVKALLLRALRIVSRDQTVFNSAVLESLRIALGEIERGVNGALLRADSARAWAEETAERTAESLRASQTAELAKEAAAREAIGQAVHDVELRIDRESSRRDSLEARLSALETASSEHDARLLKLSRLEDSFRHSRLEWTALRGALERERTVVSEPSTASASAHGERRPAPRAHALHAGIYADFERTFRGSEEEIRRRQAADVALFSAAPEGGRVVDLGCGRGEFLELLRSAGLEAAGCDTNPVMVARAKEKRLEVACEDLFSWLGDCPDGSLRGIAAYQVVEHFPPERVIELVGLATTKLFPGGVLLLETINPESVYAMKWFWMDLTHVRPVPAPSLAHLLESAGLRDVRIDRRSPVPAAEALPEGSIASPAFERLAALLFAPQDYAAIGVR